MAVPSLPTALNTGDVVDNAWVDAVRDCLSWYMDDRPMLVINGTDVAITSGSPHDWSFSDGSGSFVDSPATNQGGWTAASGGNPEIVVPEAGWYQIHGWFRLDPPTGSTTYYTAAVTDNGSDITGIRDWRHESQANIAGDVYVSFSGLRHYAASDRLGIVVEHDNGSSLNGRCLIHALWVSN